MHTSENFARILLAWTTSHLSFDPRTIAAVDFRLTQGMLTNPIALLLPFYLTDIDGLDQAKGSPAVHGPYLDGWLQAQVPEIKILALSSRPRIMHSGLVAGG